MKHFYQLIVNFAIVYGCYFLFPSGFFTIPKTEK